MCISVIKESTDLSNFQQSCILQYGHEGFDKCCLCRGIHSFTDDFMHAVTGTFTQQRHCEKPQQDFNEAFICNQHNVNPRHICTDDIEAHADHRWMCLIIGGLHTQTTLMVMFQVNLSQPVAPSPVCLILL